MRPYLAEAAGTFCLVLIGCGSIVIAGDGILWTLAICTAFGLAVWGMIILFCNISGAHINPAVSIAFALEGRLPYRDLPGYILGQCIGALLAGYVLLGLSGHPTLGATTTDLQLPQVFAIEAIITCVLMLSILWVADPLKEPTIPLIALVVGVTVGILAFGVGPMTGASMNPARSIGPAIPSGVMDLLWLYIIAPTIGAITAVPLWNALQQNNTSTDGITRSGD